jgi:gluconate kinase
MQAAYKAENRNFLMHQHPTLTFVHVTAPIDLIMSRLRKRGDAVLPEYAQSMALGFEPPKGVPILVNDTEERDEIVARFMGEMQRLS